MKQKTIEIEVDTKLADWYKRADSAGRAQFVRTFEDVLFRERRTAKETVVRFHELAEEISSSITEEQRLDLLRELGVQS